MAKLIKTYDNVVFDSLSLGRCKKISKLRKRLLGMEGKLEIFESETRDPGKKFVAFTVNDDARLYLATSLGTIEETGNMLKVSTHSGKHTYTFDMEYAEVID